MRFALVLVVLAVAGCQSLLGIDDLSLATDAGGTDVPVDVDPARCLGGGLILVCPEPPPTMDLVVAASQVIDTDANPACVAQTSGGLEVCVIVRTAIDIGGGASLRAVGKRPLVLVSTTSISVKGVIDASSVLGKPPGAGADSALCMPGPISGATGAGGVGGSFGGMGGRGGINSSPPGTLATLDHVQGGCPGGRGNANPPTAGGSGGGAVYLIAKEQIIIDGTINGSGAGGDAIGGLGFGQNGGGGGGAGGLIGLDAPMISGGGTLFANGGGGGGGSSQLGNAEPGSESPSATIPGQGGNGSGDGGNGSIGTMLDGQAGISAQAGGGGGGGAGVIYARGVFSVTGRISPPPRMP